MTCTPAISAAHQLPLDMDTPAYAVTSPQTNGAICGCAETTERQRKHDAMLLLVKREILINERAIAQRRHSKTSGFDKEIKQITHALMACKN